MSIGQRKAILVAFVLALVSVLFFMSASARRDGRTGLSVTPPPADTLPRYYAIPDFELIDTESETFGRADLDGTHWVVDFIFTSCTGPCPVMTGAMADIYGAFEDDPNVRFLSITVDPETDTPEVLRAYAQQFGATPDRWKFLTGDREAIHKLAVEGFKLGSVENPLIHSEKFVLLDDTGFVRGYYEGTNREDSVALARDLSRLVRR